LCRGGFFFLLLFGKFSFGQYLYLLVCTTGFFFLIFDKLEKENLKADMLLFDYNALYHGAKYRLRRNCDITQLNSVLAELCLHK
jgi:hypothetical protein